MTFQNSIVIIFMSSLDTYRKRPKTLLYRICVFVNFYFLFTTIAGFSEHKPMGLFLRRRGGTYTQSKKQIKKCMGLFFRDGLNTGGYFRGFTVY